MQKKSFLIPSRNKINLNRVLLSISLLFLTCTFAAKTLALTTHPEYTIWTILSSILFLTAFSVSYRLDKVTAGHYNQGIKQVHLVFLQSGRRFDHNHSKRLNKIFNVHILMIFIVSIVLLTNLENQMLPGAGVNFLGWAVIGSLLIFHLYYDIPLQAFASKNLVENISFWERIDKSKFLIGFIIATLSFLNNILEITFKFIK